MLVRGRRLDPRRILRYLFQELLAPWIQIKRLWLRVTWFFTTPIYIGPMWTSSVCAGLVGVMLTIMLFKPPSRLEASTTPAAPRLPEPILTFAPLPTAPQPAAYPEVMLNARFLRTSLGYEWDQLRQTTLVSTSPLLHPQSILQPIRDGWQTARRRLTDNWPTVYRQTAPLWNPSLIAMAVQPSDRPVMYGGANESHPALVVTRDLPAEAPPSEPITYSLIVQNRGGELLEQILVSEELANLDRVEATHPPAEVSATALHWRIDALRPGQERRLSVTLQPGADREIQAQAEVRISVAVSTATRVTAVQPLTINETPPALMETPRLAAPVEPASREVPPRVPRLSVVAEIPSTLRVDDELSTVFVVSNTGNGDADGVVLTVEVPAGLEHRDGPLVEHRYAHIPAGTTKRAIFKALARTPSTARIDAVLTMGGIRVADWTTDVQIAARPVAPPSVSAPAPQLAAPAGTSSIPGASSTPGPLSNSGTSSIPGAPSIPGTSLNSLPVNPAPGIGFGVGGPVPEDGPRLQGSPFGVGPLPAAAPAAAPAIGTTSPAPITPPMESSVPRIRREPARTPPAAGLSSPPPAGAVPGTTVPGATIPGGSSAPANSPTPPAGVFPQQDPPDEGNFVNVPRRQGAGAVSGWKRIMHR